ncbi:hypothetical protein PHYPSEUDO_010204 [Phytophthora pseudosyringae]|uniref:PARP-type domain-containing protein n=1 Tax=Phytophthora pseudosyringae TaxID=221518 RepID=A0A8T1WD32_9STRA|nr:hypothetical protein PHYPSEUDO_010204 [Phytophthora pseudosyringae]
MTSSPRWCPGATKAEPAEKSIRACWDQIRGSDSSWALAMAKFVARPSPGFDSGPHKPSPGWTWSARARCKQDSRRPAGSSDRLRGSQQLQVAPGRRSVVSLRYSPHADARIKAWTLTSRSHSDKGHPPCSTHPRITRLELRVKQSEALLERAPEPAPGRQQAQRISRPPAQVHSLPAAASAPEVAGKTEARLAPPSPPLQVNQGVEKTSFVRDIAPHSSSKQSSAVTLQLPRAPQSPFCSFGFASLTQAGNTPKTAEAKLLLLLHAAESAAKLHPRLLPQVPPPGTSPRSSNSWSRCDQAVARVAPIATTTCQVCSKCIAKGEWQLGLMFIHVEGFMLMEWYHLQCSKSLQGSGLSDVLHTVQSEMTPAQKQEFQLACQKVG